MQRNGWPADVFFTNYHQFISIHRHIMHHYAAICHRPVQSHWYALVRSVFAGFRDLSPSPCLFLVASPSKKGLNKNSIKTRIRKGSHDGRSWFRKKKGPQRGRKRAQDGRLWFLKMSYEGRVWIRKRVSTGIMVRQRVSRRSRWFQKYLKSVNGPKRVAFGSEKV